MKKLTPSRVITYVILCLFLVMDIFPLWWVFNTSFRNNTNIYANTLRLAESFDITNFITAWKKGRIEVYLPNSLIAVSITIAAVLLVSSMAAYVTARYWRSAFLFTYLSMGLMIPVHVLLIPEKIILMKLGLTASRWGIVLVYIPFYFSLAYMLVYPYIQGVPRELEEAASIDGCGRCRMFFQIVVPVAKPGFATAAVMVAYQSWNEYLLPLCLITKNKYKLVAQGLQELKGEYGTDYGLMCAGIMLTVVPIILIYALFQKHIVAGVSSGALKG